MPTHASLPPDGKWILFQLHVLSWLLKIFPERPAVAYGSYLDGDRQYNSGD